MGRPIRQVSYDAATNTVSGSGVHGLPVRVHAFARGADVPGAAPLSTYDGAVDTGTGRFSIVLTGLAAGDYSLRWAPRDIPMHAATERLDVTKPA